MSNRLTKAEKETYKIGTCGLGHWTGRCPVCRAIFHPTDIETTQAALMLAIQNHEKEAHSGNG